MTHRMAGFTLLELLVALVVLGFVLAGIAQGVLFGLHAWDTQTRDIAVYADTDATDRILRSLVAEMDPGSLTEDPTISGGVNRLAFQTDLGRAAAALAVHEADVAVVVEGGSLVLQWTPAAHAVRLTPAPRPATAVLLGGVERVEFAYWGHGDSGAGAWLAAWTERDIPPLVRIRLVFPPGAHRRWPDIVAPTMRVKAGG